MRKEPGFSNYNVFRTYMGGDTCTQIDGYVWEFAPHHHLANRWGWVAQHRLIGEELAGRPLLQSKDPNVREVVHHRDEVKTNNAPENLEVMTFSAHMRHHMAKRNRARDESLTAEMVREILRVEGSIFAAAKKIGCHPQTIRNRFPELLGPYLRASPIDLSATEQHDQILEVLRYFAPTSVPIVEVATLTKTCAKSLRALCLKHGIDWPLRKKGPRPGSKFAKTLRKASLETSIPDAKRTAPDG